jgi:hypothetical protein
MEGEGWSSDLTLSELEYSGTLYKSIKLHKSGDTHFQLHLQYSQKAKTQNTKKRKGKS